MEGLAYIFPPVHGRNERDTLPHVIPLPHLTSQTVKEWLVRRTKSGQVIGGFQLALNHAGIWLLNEWIRRVERGEQERTLALPLREVPDALPAVMDTLQQALRWIVESWRAEADLLSGGEPQQQEGAKKLRERLALPLEVALAQGVLERELGWFLYDAELETLLPQLSEVIMVPLRQWLNALQLDAPTQQIAFVPHGRLRWLPLKDALVPDTHTGKRVPGRHLAS